VEEEENAMLTTFVAPHRRGGVPRASTTSNELWVRSAVVQSTAEGALEDVEAGKTVRKSRQGLMWFLYVLSRLRLASVPHHRSSLYPSELASPRKREV
jgi:hypothetical protein